MVLLAFSEVAYGLYAGPDDVVVYFRPEILSVSPGCPKAAAVLLSPREDFHGKVNLTAVDLPQGVTVVFDPNPVEVPIWEDEFTSLLVNVAPETPQGRINLTFHASGLSVSLNGGPVEKTMHFILNIGSPCEQPAKEVKTTTITAASQTTLTTTTTVISTTAETKTAIFTTYTETKTIPTNWLDIIQATSIGIGITVAGVTIALATFKRRGGG